MNKFRIMQNKKKDSASQNSSVPESNNTDTSGKEDGFYFALNHELRRKMLQYLGEHKIASFTEFKKLTGVSTGTIYHHLDAMKNLIAQNENKKYFLSPLGERAYRSIGQTKDTLESPKIIEKKEITKETKTQFLEWILLKPLLDRLEKRPIYGWIISVLAPIVTGILCFVWDLDSYLFFLFPSQESDVSISLQNLIQFFSVIISFFVLFGICEFLIRVLYSKKENWRSFLNLLGICYIPLLFYLILYGVLMNIPLFTTSTLNKVIMIIFQTWAMFLLSYLISIKKFVKFERGLIVSFFINYGTMMIVFAVRIRLI